MVHVAKSLTDVRIILPPMHGIKPPAIKSKLRAASRDLGELDLHLKLKIHCTLFVFIHLSSIQRAYLLFFFTKIRVPIVAKKVDALEERLEGEMSQIKATVEGRISSMEDKFSNLEVMMKKALELHNPTVASEARVSVGGNTNYGSHRDDHDVEILEGEERRPLQEPIQREEIGRTYGESREHVGYERRGSDFGRREVDYNRRGANFEGRRGEIEEGFGLRGD
ncbi:hypothetical protein M5K25_017391 [Dendrobium thyrsiflorum]|uniref:Uncharacterized protein n=1 Tax=Dendrobium thyrsiflorum TaxID=117978 RepID=A0ABD0UML2_DENTH